MEELKDKKQKVAASNIDYDTYNVILLHTTARMYPFNLYPQLTMNFYEF